MLGLMIWLGIGVLVARVFGAFIGRRWWERDEDDQDLATGGSA
jgi:hypothetical protein